MADSLIPPDAVPPKFTRLAGEALWLAVLNRYELEQHELLLLREIVRTVDDLDRLAGIAGKHGAVTSGGGVHPALAEARQMRMTLATLIGALRLPDENEEDLASSVRRPHRRPAVRSVDPPAPQSGSRRAAMRSVDPPAPPQSLRAVVRGNNPPLRTPRVSPRAVVGSSDPSAPSTGHHFTETPTVRSSQISVPELIAKVRKSDAGMRSQRT